MQSLNRRGARVAIIVSVGVLALTSLSIGIVQSVAGAGDPSSSVTGPTFLPMPTPTDDGADVLPAAIAEAPQPRVPSECSELIPHAAVDAVLGVATEISLTTPSAVTSAATIQGGALQCTWLPAGEGASPWAGAWLSVIPADRERLLDAWPASGGDDYERYGTSGDRSAISCGSYEGFGCVVGMLVDAYWVDISLNNPDRVLDLEASYAAADQVADAVAVALRRSGPPLPAWVPPAGSLAVGLTCETLDARGAIASALPRLELGESMTIGTDAWSGIVFEAWRQADFGFCTVPSASGHGIDIFVLPGGSWAWAPERLAPDGDGGWIPSVSGADAALGYCDRPESIGPVCKVVLSAGGSLFEFSARDADVSQAQKEAEIAAEAWLAEYGN